MDDKWLVTPCGICGAGFYGAETICQECQQSFASGIDRETFDTASPLDLAKYGSQMFPWEQMVRQPRLISVDPSWVALALGLVILVVLLALLRAPLPSCWELSS